MASDFCWLGNELCLDFHNTARWTDTGSIIDDNLSDQPRLLAWFEEAGIVAPDDTAHRSAARDKELLRQAIALRGVIHSVFAPAASHETPSASHLAALNDFLALVIIRVDWDASTAPMMSSEASGELPPMLTPIVWSAASLLVSAFHDKIGQCANPECGWLYVDLSRRGNRRWCDMQTCGNRAKAKRHYERVREG